MVATEKGLEPESARELKSINISTTGRADDNFRIQDAETECSEIFPHISELIEPCRVVVHSLKNSHSPVSAVST